MADSDFLFNSDWNYQKILVNQSLTQVVTSGSSATYTYTHNLGKITSARVWVEGKTGKWFPAANITLQDHFTFGADYTATYGLTMNTLKVTLYNSSASNSSVNFRIRIYLDD